MAFNSKVSKELNKELILSCIRNEEFISKIEISKLLVLVYRLYQK